MRLCWPFRRRGCSQPSDEARHAVAYGQRQLQDVDRLSARVDEAVEQLHEIRRRNHFGDAIASAFRGAPE